VVTREPGAPGSFVRIVEGLEGEAAVDYRGKLKGRGAWLTPRREVVQTAEAKSAILQRALHAPALVTAGLLDRVVAANLVAVLDLLSLCARAGVLVGGADAIGRLRPELVLAYLVAADASEASVDAVKKVLEETPSFRMPLDRESLGHRVGKGPRAVIAIRPAGPGRALVVELRRMQALR
jgi:predicted RNA-binding protein YlxR (DUF448 family)